MISIILKHFLLAFCFSVAAFSQNDSTHCNSPEARQFDFWIGTWDLTWKSQDGSEANGKNIIKSVYNGCVIEENFNGNPGMNFKGMSVSAYSTILNKWQQTWVDDRGSYLDFTGEFKDGKMILSRNAVNKKGEKFLQRMVWYNISEDELDWNWERSDDGGANWKVLWHIHYQRAG